MDNLGVSIKSCDEMLETLDIHVCNICVEFSTTILSAPSKRHKKKKMKLHQKIMLKKSKNVHIHKVDQCTKRNQEREYSRNRRYQVQDTKQRPPNPVLIRPYERLSPP